MSIQADVMFLGDPKDIQTDATKDANIWDDTALIKAYDIAVESVKKDLNINEDIAAIKRKNNQKRRLKKRKNKKKSKWCVGDRCQSKYANDGSYYEATIKSMNRELGTCWVTYEEYGNEEEVDVVQLRPSHYKNQTQRPDISENETGSMMEWTDHPGLHRNPWMSQMPPPFAPPFTSSFVPPFPQPFAMPSVSPYAGPHFPWPNEFQNTKMPPPPPVRLPSQEVDGEDEAMHSMLIAWYMSGYHTGYYQGLKDGEIKGKGTPSKQSKPKRPRNAPQNINQNQVEKTPSTCKEQSEGENET